MKKIFRNIIILIAPFLIMFVVNELSQHPKKPDGIIFSGVKTINYDGVVMYECSWHCHQNTQFCIDNHTHFLQPVIDYINPIYFAIIDGLFATGNYGLANIVFLVILWPLLMYFLLIKCLNLRSKLKQTKHNE
ncbi:MAG: hypothetical protein ACPG4Z_00050 [Chitinophagales bacterium]